MTTKTALITGASFGIGTAFAQELAARQMNLILVARSQDKLYQLAETLKQETAIEVEVIVQDLVQPGATKAVYDRVQEKGLTVDLLINNAGFGDYGAFTERDLSRQVEMIQLNVVALVELTHLFLPQMQQKGSGGIINVASIAAFQPLPYLSVYAATKAFVLSLSEALWAENKDTGVNILALCPGPTESNFFKVADFPESFAGKSNGQLTSAEEVVKDALKALENNQSNCVTGGFANQLIVNASRFVPREFLVNAVEKQFRA
ncbi:short-chain dehydrogenase/reductase SDR [Rippkaea orientalis PCC 8801]|uniref:Short-chain dehydrogenase/reductase SDR n=1 Tax=Rippkaea orientalis (strain PCC 8801 / RF-1) TaxID=41431 RepID=B7K1T9_RIPO1|nr:SDR family oxidoreductase [Rippkaea orientalis]ACK64246.1 short-chain dehydrogenase/reductase SDR [Rippkaea orientalis PCC 8801]